MNFYERPLEEVFEEFGTDPKNGLSESTVAKRRAQYGLNTLKEEKKEEWWRVLIRQFTGILIIILAVAAIISGLFGEWVDTAAILVILLVNGIIGFWQEWKAQASIDSLRKMASSKASVMRSGKVVQLHAEELVPGDVLVLQTGDRIPADCRVIESASLETAEGALTGESTPVSKKNTQLQGEVALAEQKNMLFSGTIITKGRGRAVVVATGMKTEIGQIAHLIQETDVEETPLQEDLDSLGAKLGRATIVISASIFAIILGSRIGNLTLESLKEPFLLSISLAVAAIPEGLPIVVTIALAFGTQRMAKRHALIKRLASVETLGSTTVICTDKTGTLTKNEMTVTRLWHAGKTVEVTGTGYGPQGEVQGLLPSVTYEVAALCNDAKLTEELQVVGDPTEGCLLTLARKAGFHDEEVEKEHPRVGEIPFSSERKRMSTIHAYGDQRVLLSKGGPDVILKHCTHILWNESVRPLTDEDRAAIIAQNESFAKEALRVLAFAFKSVDDKEEYVEADEEGLIFVALAGMIDPPREEAKAAVARCHEAGIRVVMITGDHKITAMAIAEAIGINGKAVEGNDLDDIDLDKEVADIAIYARVDPEHKMMIIEALKKRGDIVAMTGDGVNDAPALKRADIGVAMGIAGTDVAKESASMILTDDNFASVVSAVEEGRAIYSNIKKFVNYLLSSNFAEVLAIFLAILFFRHDGNIVWPLTGTMILFMNLVTDSLPALALGVDPGDKKAMKKPPRDPEAKIISHNMLINIVIIGVLVALATLAMFKHALDSTGSLAYAQTMALTTLVVLEIVRLAMIRSQYNTPLLSNLWLYAAVIFVMGLQLAVVYLPIGNAIFGTVPLEMSSLLLIVITSAITYAIGMAVNTFARKITGQRD